MQNMGIDNDRWTDVEVDDPVQDTLVGGVGGTYGGAEKQQNVLINR